MSLLDANQRKALNAKLRMLMLAADGDR